MPVQKSKLTATSDINKIVQGESLTLTVEVFDEVSKQVLDLADLTAAVASLPGTEATVTVELADGIEVADDPGRLLITLDETLTAALNVGDAQSWQIELTVGDDIRIVQLVEVLEVVAPLF